MIEPRRHNPQTQPITVALKNICRDYPAGGGVLRELLQNADDAGASSVKFVLDQTNHPTATLVHDDLAEYQGPSLLAYNDATFSKKDFDSLSRIGDSCKLQDGSTTGRFGRGFNAVYNWTDSPSIVSRDSLLILDPHHTWSRCFDRPGSPSSPGGPVYDFVEHAKTGLMQDQMVAFSAITPDLDQPFPGTIIRIPLRTSEQARKSLICTREAPPSEIAQVLQTFVDDFGHTGLLFMKNVSQISVAVGAEPPMTICISNNEEVRRCKSEVNAAIKKTILEGGISFNRSFNIEIKRGIPGKEEQYLFALHHSIQNYPEDKSLKSWSKDEAMIPWVAVASEIEATAGTTGGGSLYNVLPSQIRINQPLHIHSCFSMSPDRARLHELGDNSVQYPLPGLWNRWLLDELLPTAWTNLLLYLAEKYPKRSSFDMWPNSEDDSNDISYGIQEKVLQTIEQNSYPLWYTDLGYITLRSGLVSKNNRPSALRNALSEAGVPVIYLTDRLLSNVEMTCKVEHLSPQTLCDRLERGQEQLRAVSEATKETLLDYVISDSKYRGYGAIELFPFEDGTYKAIEKMTAFIHRDDAEQLLFLREPNRNIDLQKLSKTTQHILQTRCSLRSLHFSLQHRSTYDLKNYCLQTYFKAFDSREDLVHVDEEIRTFISKVWVWIATRQQSILDENISCLWLLPLSDGRHRKIKPTDARVGTIYTAPGDLGDFLQHLTNTVATSNKPIIKVNDLTPRSVQLLIHAIKKDPSLFIKSSDSINDFLLWLGEIREVFELVADGDRWRLHMLLASHLTTVKKSWLVLDILRGLKVFQRVFWRAENDLMVLHQAWVTLNGHSSLIGLRKIDPLPDLGDVTFLNAESDDTERVLRFFGLASCPTALELLARFMIPFWEDGKSLRNWTTSAKEKITRSLLRNFHNLDDSCKKRISSSAIIPVKCFNRERSRTFSMAKELIYPFAPTLRELYFDDEEVCPADWVLADYSGILFDCGLRTVLDDALVVERVKCFAKRSAEIEETSKRARTLLRSSPSWKTDQGGQETSILGELQWLPVTDLDGSRVFRTAKECRGSRDKLLVGYVLPVLDFDISHSWRNHLGWNDLIPHTILLAQLKQGIEKKERKVVDTVLKYVHTQDQVDGMRQDLMRMSCIVASNGQFVTVSKAFDTGCNGLQPYLYSIDTSFGIKHKSLLQNLGVTEKPKFEDLLAVQDQLPSEESLNGTEISVAIELSKLASILPGGQMSQFKILDATGILRATKDVTFNDCVMSTIKGNFNSTHPDIPKTVIDAFRIEPMSVRLRKGELGIEDADDDEFDQHEDVATAISDTLGRYTVESTFKEFLANADDCKDAKEVNWLLDKTEYPRSDLLTDELGRYQGPALLVHNDGVFNEKDFEGLRRVGRGSKRDDVKTIGKFGRGSQTMYHWTDVPMLLSGKYLVILDPLRQVLDLNYRTGHRKPGVKIELAKLKGACRNQLSPFEGLWGFSKESDYYHGTIFRFPLRHTGAQSRLMETGTSLGFDATRKYLENFLEREGRISMLFLRNVQLMDFKLRGDEEPRWSIQSEKKWLFCGWTYCTITKCMDDKRKATFKDRWRVAIEDPDNVPSELQFRHKRTMKDVECGIAALVPDPKLTQTPMFPNDPVPKYFSTLPLAFQTGLPIHIHTTFALASDRASIPVEDSMQEDGAKWNRWLLSTAIPRLYLDFLEDLGREIIELKDPFAFWPQVSPSKGHLSEPIYTSFWQALPKSSCKLFPTTRQVKAARNKKREPPKLVTIGEAVFDLLQRSESETLRGILESQIQTLVRPPTKIRNKLQRGIEVKSVTAKRLCEIFKQENASKCLEKAAIEDNAVLETLLALLKPILDEGCTELDGCRILPVADGTLGQLRLASPIKQAHQYFLADGKELQLFDFALCRLVACDPVNEFKKAILDCGKFNVTRLDLTHLGTLLERKDFGNKTPTTEMDIWLLRFWDYYRHGENSRPNCNTPFTSKLEIGAHPVFKATSDKIESYIEPQKLDILPSVIEPDKSQQRSLCLKFPGIYMFSFIYLPTYLRTTETSLDTRASFTRFIATLGKLAKQEGVELETYVKKYLDAAEIKLLQKLVVKYVSAEPSIKDQDMRYLLRLLPVWPTTKPSTWITATNALATKSTGLLVPWTTGYEKFIEQSTFISNSSTMRVLGVYEIPGNDLLLRTLTNLPPIVNDINKYRSFIRAISQVTNLGNVLSILNQSKIAPNRAKLLVPAHDLFDHNDEIFTSAFRNEADKMFLLRELEESNLFWRKIGLRHRVNGLFEPAADYILCLKKMRERLESRKNQDLDRVTARDALVVLEPLTTPSTALSRLSKQDWSVVERQATFPSIRIFNDQSSHRRSTRDLVATATPMLPLSEVIGSQYMSICWSQIPFPVATPTVATLAELTSRGKPSTATVWRHVEHMASSVTELDEDAVAAFLSDLYNSYDYLQENLEDSVASYTVLQESRVWFNLDYTDNSLVHKLNLESNRCSLKNLILESSSDNTNLHLVRQGLLRYQKLLRALGCKSIVYPSVEAPQAQTNHTVSTDLNRLRLGGLLLDLTLEAEGGSVRAHKVVMAAASGFFATQFKEHWSNHDNIDLKPFAHSTVSTVVDFAYADIFDWAGMQVREAEYDRVDVTANKLDDFLDLLEAAEFLDMPRLKAQVEDQILHVRRLFIREHNVLGVLERAARAKASRVVGYCNVFYADNMEAVDLAMME